MFVTRVGRCSIGRNQRHPGVLEASERAVAFSRASEAPLTPAKTGL
jgi:hypothetical protein